MIRFSFIGLVVLLLAFCSSIQNGFTFTTGGRIAGGQHTTIEEFPYQAHISHFNRTHCGGSIISERTILTAAHCIALATQKELEVRLGVTDVSKEGGIHRQVARTIVHENYNDQNVQNDIALVILSEPLQFSDTIQPISIPKQDQQFPGGSRAFVSGWGIEEQDKEPSPVLKFAEVFVVEQKKCSIIASVVVTNKMMCAVRPDQGHPCNSDSGGPLAIYDETDKPLIIGVVSFGAECSVVGSPMVYTKVASYRNWIEAHME